MNKTSKKIAVFSICFLLFSGIFAQTYFVSINSSSNFDTLKSEENLTPKSSDVSTSYDLGDGNSMDLDGTVSGDDGSTTSTMNCGDCSSSLPITSDFDKGDSAINNGSSTTLINNTYEIITLGDNKTILKNNANGFNVTVDNDFNPHGVEINTPYDSTTVSNVQADIGTGELNHFDVDSFFDVVYNVDYGGGKTDLTLSDLGCIVSRDWYGEWITVAFGVETYNITYTGDIFLLGFGLIGFIGDCHYNAGFSTIESANDTIIITDGTIEVIVVLCGSYFQMSIYHLFQPYSIVWDIISYTITIYWYGWVYTFYTWIFYELIYVIVYINYDWKIEYYYTYIVIVWMEIVIEIWFLDIFIYWTIYYVWCWWIIWIEWWFVYETYWYFYQYYIDIKYHYSINQWQYRYYVPTIVLPNPLDVEIVRSEYTESYFKFTFKVTDWLDNPITPTTVTAEWGGIDVSVDLIPFGTGMYNLTVTPIWVSPGGTPILLNITADDPAYSKDELLTDIAVEEITSVPVPSSTDMHLTIKNSTFTETLFNITFTIRNSSDLSGIESAGITANWNDIDVSSDVNEIGNGEYYVNLTPVWVEPGEDPILLEFDVTAAGYDPITNHQCFYAVEEITSPTPSPDNLGLVIQNNTFTENFFNITFWVLNLTDLTGVENANINATWNGLNFTSNIFEIGNGYYYIELTAITVSPGEDPILLRFDGKATGFIDLNNYKAYYAVDPEVIAKGDIGTDDGEEEDDDGKKPSKIAIPGPSLFLIGIMAVIGMIFATKIISKKKKIPMR